MALIGIDSWQPFPDATGYSVNNTELRVWYGRSFLDSDGVSVQNGNGTTGFYIAVPVTVTSDLSIASFFLRSTLDAIDPAPQSIQCFARLFSNNTPKAWIFAGNDTSSGWAIPNPTPLTTMTYGQLAIYNQTTVLANPAFTTWSASQIQAYFDSLSPAPNASDITKGITELSVAPANALTPIAVGNNDPRVLDVSTYSSFANAISTLGSTPATLNITSDLTIAGTVAPPANITLRFLQGGGLTITGGTTTIRGPIEADRRKIFTLSGGTLSFSGNSVIGPMKPEWWANNTTPGTTVMSTALQAAIIAAQQSTLQVSLDGTTYFLTSGLTISTDSVSIEGAGFYATILQFNPSLSGDVCLNFTAGASMLSFCRLANLGMLSTSLTPKVGVRIVDTTEFEMENVKINGFTSTAKDSIGIQTRGRQANSFRDITITADTPISIENNPNSLLDVDHYQLTNLYLVADVTKPCISVADGVNLSNITFDGYQSWVQGKHGFYYNDTTTVIPNSYGLVIKNVRWEQNTDDTGYLIYISSNTNLERLLIENTMGGGVHGNQFYFRKVIQATFINTEYQGSLIALNADSTCGTATEPFRFINNNWGSGTLTTSGFIFQNGTKNDGRSYDTIEVAIDEVKALIFASGGGAMTRGFVDIIGQGQGARFYIHGGNAPIQLNTASLFSTTANNAGTTNVYYNGTRYVIQNKTATLYTYAIYAELDTVNQ